MLKIQNQITYPIAQAATCGYRPPTAHCLLPSVRGVALVAVLAVLVVLTILAASFSVMMNLELKQSTEQQNSFQLDMLVESGMEHSKSLLMDASNVGQAYHLSTTSNDKFSRWFYVKDDSGKITGRYRIKFEDEAGKVNINRARLPGNSKGFGWDTGEVNLPRALGVPPDIAKKVIKYRYGPNRLPGGRGDDDQNNVILMADGIDNNANGIVDEEDEGLNDPGEYKANNLSGDDRKFSTINETVSILLDSKKKLPFSTISKLRNLIPTRATIYSTDEPGSPTLNNKIAADINCLTARDCRKLITKANERKTFIPGGQKRAQLAANIVDYRDENHVLSTLGSTYGVEAVCFNEVMANDESVTHDLVYSRLGLQNWQPDWKGQFGMEDNKRCIYCPDLFFGCIPDSPSPKAKGWQVLDPRRAWRVEFEDPNLGKLKSQGGSHTITLPKAPGRKGNEIQPGLFRRGKSDQKNALAVPERIPAKNSGKDCYSWPTGNENYPTAWNQIDVFGNESQDDYEDHCKEMLDVLKKLGKAEKYRPKLDKDYFKNSLAMVYVWQKRDDAEKSSKAIGCFKIKNSDDNSITFENKSAFEGPTFSDKINEAFGTDWKTKYDLSLTINSWANSRSMAWVPEANQRYLIRSRRPRAGKYFKVIIGRPPKSPDNVQTGMLGYPNELGCSGRIGGGFSEDKNFKRRLWEYNDGKPVQTQQDGWIDVLLTSAKTGIEREELKGQTFFFIRMQAPEVTEMYNASATPVSLANWRVICNTGSKATEIGLIRSTSYYDKKLRKKITTDNPVVDPGGHFYLVNDLKLFDYWYGSGNGEWGSSPKEEIPVFEMDQDNWGVAYKIKKTAIIPGQGLSISLKNFDFDAREIFNLETIKFIDKKRAKDPRSWNNAFTYVRNVPEQAKDELFTWIFSTEENCHKYLKGTDLMIIGLPYSGGIVSLTLKNEYEQICARTVDYGKVEVYELGKSSEKIDPTKNTWKKRNKHSIAGQNRNALNRAMRTRRGETYFIKNGPYGSVGELRHVSTGNDFDRLGGQKGDISKGLESIGAIADVASCSHIRLEAASGNVVRKGWKEAKDEVVNSSLKTITCKNGDFQVDKWKGQSVKFLTGPLRGEKFVIIANTKNVITFADDDSPNNPYSAPNKKLCQPNRGDIFSLGPGYASALCFTRTGGDVGEWTWKKAVSRPDNKGHRVEQNLYIYGLNDAIDTTEFFEENNNASLDVDVWNWNTKKYDSFCKKKKYGKQDSFHAGKIGPQHISDSGDFRIRLTAHDITENFQEAKNGEARLDTGGRKTGTAWFNYAAITPVPVPARVNINTAPARLLASLPGVSVKLARNIEAGIGRNKNNSLKPYKTLGDVMKVQGMTPEIFERCANMLCVNSSFFTVEIEAQTLASPLGQKTATGGKRVPDSTRNVTGSRSKRYVLKSDKSNGATVSFDILEKYSL